MNRRKMSGSKKNKARTGKPGVAQKERARRGRESTASGNVKIRQTWTKDGAPIFAVSLPVAAMDLLGWEPGIYLTYYPTVEGELVFVPQGQVLKHLSPDYDRRADARPVERRGPKEGTMAAIEVEREVRMQELLRKMGDPQADPEDAAIRVPHEQRVSGWRRKRQDRG